MGIPTVNRVTIPAHHLITGEGRRGSVHSIFERGINLIIGGRLLHLQWERELSSPFSIELEGNSISVFKGKIMEGDMVLKDGDYIEIGSFGRIKYIPKEFYNPRLYIFSGCPGLKIDQIYETLETEIKTFKKMTPSNSFLAETESILKRENERLFQSLKDSNFYFKIFKEFSNKLIGLGPGLTPFCDDFFVGMLAILTPFQKNSEGIKKILHNLRSSISLCLKKTCGISREFLRYAIDGAFSEKLNNIITSILNHRSDREGIRWIIRKGLDFGASSGIGTMMGIRCGIKLIHALSFGGDENG